MEGEKGLLVVVFKIRNGRDRSPIIENAEQFETVRIVTAKFLITKEKDEKNGHRTVVGKPKRNGQMFPRSSITI